MMPKQGLTEDAAGKIGRQGQTGWGWQEASRLMEYYDSSREMEDLTEDANNLDNVMPETLVK